MNNKDIEELKTLKLVTAIGETVLAIPIYWWLLIISFLWIPLIVMLILHAITLAKSSNLNIWKKWSIMWVITSLIWWVPLVWMLFHIITAIMLWIDYSNVKIDKKEIAKKEIKDTTEL